MKAILFILILGFGAASYGVGLYQILKGRYHPSLFSRIVWLLLAANSFAGVALSGSTQASVLLAAVLLAGNAAICMASFWRGSREFGRLEYVCLGLLALSGLVWILFNAPLLNLALSLFAHLIGGAPTFKKVWLVPSSESTAFWSLFFVASLLSILASLGSDFTKVIFPIYFTVFDGGMFFLSTRKRQPAYSQKMPSTNS